MVKRTNEKLWKSIVTKVKKNSKGGKKNQWSARKAQLAVKEYKEKGGKYIGKKSKKNSLVKWTKQKWRTKSGKNSIQGPNSTGERYLPDKAIKSLTKKEYNKSTNKKRKSIKLGKQYSKQSKKITNKIRRYRFSRKKEKEKKYKGYSYLGIKKSTKKGKKYMASFEKNGRKKVIHFGSDGMSDYTKHKDKKRMMRYLSRHRKRENWDDLMTAGALSRWILWNKPSFRDSVKDYERRL